MPPKQPKIPYVLPVEAPSTMDHPAVPYTGVLPEHPFSMGVIAPKGSGKTTLICNFMLNFYKGYFHQIHIFSPTIFNDDKWGVVRRAKHLLGPNKKYLKFLKKVRNKQGKNVQLRVLLESPDTDLDEEIRELEKLYKTDLKIPETCFHSEYTEETLQVILDKQDEKVRFIRENLPEDQDDNAKYYIDRLLLVFDDLVGSNLFSNRQGHNPFKTLSVRHRHWSASIMMVSQAYMEIPKTVRTQMTCWVLFEISNDKELENIWEEFPCGLKKDKWMQLYQHATAEPYSFLYINVFFERGGRLFKRFEKKLKYIDPKQVETVDGITLKREASHPSQTQKRRRV
jgi:hypothetical protein